MCKKNKHHHHHTHRHEKNKKKFKRREFLKGTAALGLGGLALTPFFKLIKRAEVAAQVSCQTAGPPIAAAQRRAFVNLSLVGGIQFPTFIAPHDQAGIPFGSSYDMTRLGMSTPGTTRVMQTIGNAGSIPYYATCGGTNTGFFQTFASMVNPNALSSLHSMFIHGATADDSVAIRISPVYAVNSQLYHAGNEAPFFRNGLGNNVVNNGETYGSAIEARDVNLPERLMGVATEINGVAASAVPNPNFNGLPPQIRTSFLNSLDGLGRKQFSRFLTPELADKLADIYTCNIEGIKNLDPSLAGQLDLRQNPAAVAYFQNLGTNISSYADNDPRLLSITMVALQAQGLSLGCNHEPANGAWDYHFGGDINGVIAQNALYAEHLALMINTAWLLNVPLVITGITDGGCSTNSGRLQPLELWSDRGLASGVHIIALNPTEPPVRNHLGYMDANTQAAADNQGSNNWSHDEQKLGLIAIYNTYRLMGFDEGSIAPSILDFIKTKLGNDLDEFDLTKPAV